MTGSNGTNGARIGTDRVKQGLAQMLKGGVIVSGIRCSARSSLYRTRTDVRSVDGGDDGVDRGAFGVQKLPFGLAWLGFDCEMLCGLRQWGGLNRSMAHCCFFFNDRLIDIERQMDVMNVEQAKIAEAAGAGAVMALERIPADIRRDGGVARMSDPALILEIKNAVTIPVMAKARIGHIVEAQILEACEIDYIDESEVLTMADDVHHLDKTQYSVPFVCGCRNLGEALRRILDPSIE